MAWSEIPEGSMDLVRDSFRMARDILVVRLLYLARVWRTQDISL